MTDKIAQVKLGTKLKSEMKALIDNYTTGNKTVIVESYDYASFLEDVYRIIERSVYR